MSSHLFVLENCLFSDPFSPFTGSPADPLLEEIRGSTQPIDGHLENMSLSQLQNADKEESLFDFDRFTGLAILPPDFDETAAVRPMWRSYSSNSFVNKQNSRFDCVLEPRNFLNQASSSIKSHFSSCVQLRNLRSSKDFQNVTTNLQSRNDVLLSSSPPLVEEASSTVGRYSAEERKERIDRYRAKRNHRNFNKTIKYVCRKTLADNRPRIRGRFARHHMAAREIPTASPSVFHRQDDLIWISETLRTESNGSA